MLVELSVLLHLPNFLDVVEVSSQFLPASVSLLECEVFPQLLVEELVDGRIAVNTSSWIAVPIPNSSRCCTLFVDLDFEALLAEPIRSVFALDSKHGLLLLIQHCECAESCSNEQDVELLGLLNGSHRCDLWGFFLCFGRFEQIVAFLSR